ncbi:FmdB family zinc ribbon protein [Massilia sp. DD77]|uniref:FmdB family zinc ribbon protein n=1 Tax=Massilia sp. DD77 TaxID=3109349 RepID=UPI0030000298
MPIYAYRCEECGFNKDVLQKVSDPVLTTCPSCGKPAFKKQVTAAGFQLKGSGWYVTDFRGGTPPATGAAPAPGAAASGDSGAAAPAAPAATPATGGGKSDT